MIKRLNKIIICVSVVLYVFLKLIKLKIVLFILLWLCWVSVAANGLSLAGVSRGYTLAVVRGPLTTVASLVAEHR